MNPFAKKVRAPQQPMTFYELIPPSKDMDEAAVVAYAECAAELVASALVPIDAVNLPEIRAERREAQRTHPYEPKTDPRNFARRFCEAYGGPIAMVVNRCTVYEPWEEQQRWLEGTLADFSIPNVILVGGESSRIRYPGPSVTEMARSVRYVYGQAFFCGGVTIPTRRCADPEKDEAQRLLTKGRHGLGYFTSQVLCEAGAMQRLLLDYDRLCKAQGEAPCRILLSFAPISSRKDLDFLRWLGVHVPVEVAHQLLKVNIGVGWRSLQLAKRTLGEILDFVQANDVRVPLGLNVEHITRHNFELSGQFLEELGRLYAAAAG